MRSKEADHDDAVFVPHQDDQAIVICLDIEDHSTAFENTCLRMSCLHVLRRLPSSALHYGSPSIVLRSGGLDPSISGSRRKIALDDVGADYDHESAYYIWLPINGISISIFWKWSLQAATNACATWRRLRCSETAAEYVRLPGKRVKRGASRLCLVA